MPVWTWPNKPVCVAVLPGRNVWPSGQTCTGNRKTTFNGWVKRSSWFSKGKWDVFLKSVKFLCLGFFLMKWCTECCTAVSADLIQSLCCLTLKKKKVKSSLLVLPEPKYDGLITSSTGLLRKVLASPDIHLENRLDSVKLRSSRSWSFYSEQTGRNNMKKGDFSKHILFMN